MDSEVLKCMRERRSIRAYEPRQISDEALNAVLQAGTFAPTGMGRQSPKMVVVQDKETVAQLSKLNAGILGGMGDPFYGAPTVVVVFADTTRPTWLHAIAPAHMMQGSTVTYNVHSDKYLPPTVEAAAVRACISA